MNVCGFRVDLVGARVFDRFYVPTMDVLGSCDETTAKAHAAV